MLLLQQEKVPLSRECGKNKKEIVILKETIYNAN